jgi:hypothetical protein
MSRTGRPDPNESCLFIQGSDGNIRRADGGITLLGNNDLDRLLGDPAVPIVQLTADIFERSALPAVTAYRCLINQISDADCNPRVLGHLNRLLAGFTGRIINHAADVLKTSRDEMARQLHGTPGLRVPKVVRLRGSDDVDDKIERAGLSFPIILRPAGTHGGVISASTPIWKICSARSRRGASFLRRNSPIFAVRTGSTASFACACTADRSCFAT